MELWSISVRTKKFFPPPGSGLDELPT